jgi:hypothetical protein
MTRIKFAVVFAAVLLAITHVVAAQDDTKKDPQTAKAEAVISRAVATMGGANYVAVKSQVGRGMFSSMRDGRVVSFQKFVDVIVFPDKERTEFKSQGSRSVQVNTGATGWIYDGDQELIKVQNAKQIADFKIGIRTSLDGLLRGYWKGDADLSYVGRRPSTLGKRNEVVRLTFKDGFTVEFEFAADDGTPQKALYKRIESDGIEAKEEDRYGQFVDTAGIKAAYVVDRFTDGKHSSRINYDSIEFNKNISESWFAKPSGTKDAKKEFKN